MCSVKTRPKPKLAFKIASRSLALLVALLGFTSKPSASMRQFDTTDRATPPPAPEPAQKAGFERNARRECRRNAVDWRRAHGTQSQHQPDRDPRRAGLRGVRPA